MRLIFGYFCLAWSYAAVTHRIWLRAVRWPTTATYVPLPPMQDASRSASTSDIAEGEYADSGRISGSGRCEAAPGNPAFGWCSFRASLFENNLAVSSMAVNVTVNSANWRHPLSIAALPMRVNPAKQKSRCTQNTWRED